MVFSKRLIFSLINVISVCAKSVENMADLW